MPIKLEFGITPGCIVEGEKDEDIIQLGPAFGRHRYTDYMRGSEPLSKNDFIVFFTDFTNIDHKITIVKR